MAIKTKSVITSIYTLFVGVLAINIIRYVEDGQNFVIDCNNTNAGVWKLKPLSNQNIWKKCLITFTNETTLSSNLNECSHFASPILRNEMTGSLNLTNINVSIHGGIWFNPDCDPPIKCELLSSGGGTTQISTSVSDNIDGGSDIRTKILISIGIFAFLSALMLGVFAVRKVNEGRKFINARRRSAEMKFSRQSKGQKEKTQPVDIEELIAEPAVYNKPNVTQMDTERTSNKLLKPSKITIPQDREHIPNVSGQSEKSKSIKVSAAGYVGVHHSVVHTHRPVKSHNQKTGRITRRASRNRYTLRQNSTRKPRQVESSKMSVKVHNKNR